MDIIIGLLFDITSTAKIHQFILKYRSNYTGQFLIKLFTLLCIEVVINYNYDHSTLAQR